MQTRLKFNKNNIFSHKKGQKTFSVCGPSLPPPHQLTATQTNLVLHDLPAGFLGKKEATTKKRKSINQADGGGLKNWGHNSTELESDGG